MSTTRDGNCKITISVPPDGIYEAVPGDMLTLVDALGNQIEIIYRRRTPSVTKGEAVFVNPDGTRIPLPQGAILGQGYLDPPTIETPIKYFGPAPYVSVLERGITRSDFDGMLRAATDKLKEPERAEPAFPRRAMRP